jgi:F-type H+-transporting ATPase subunit b
MVLKADLIPVMLPLITLIASEESVSWLNYPGLELWKFLNLAIFLSVAIFILRRPLRQALVARREGIKAELLQAQKERDEALARLAEAEALLAHLDSDIAALREQSRAEAELERERLKLATDKELEKLKQQAQRDIETAGKIARQELRRFLANRSVELAKQSVLAELRPEDDARLIGASIAALRGSKI